MKEVFDRLFYYIFIAQKMKIIKKSEWFEGWNGFKLRDNARSFMANIKTLRGHWPDERPLFDEISKQHPEYPEYYNDWTHEQYKDGVEDIIDEIENLERKLQYKHLANGLTDNGYKIPYPKTALTFENFLDPED